MKITILTLFPDMFQGPFDFSIVKNARENKYLDLTIVNIRDFGIGSHKVVDDTPYGGGHGMVLRVDVLHRAIESVKTKKGTENVVLMSAKGDTFTQKTAKKFAHFDSLILICGHYEGVDERIYDYIDEEVSVGDFVTTGGEIPAMAVTDAVTRLIPGVLKDGVTENESFSITDQEQTLLEHPQYTRPSMYEEKNVPDILLSGNHGQIQKWRIEEAKKKTLKNRPDLLKKLHEV